MKQHGYRYRPVKALVNSVLFYLTLLFTDVLKGLLFREESQASLQITRQFLQTFLRQVFLLKGKDTDRCSNGC